MNNALQTKAGNLSQWHVLRHDKWLLSCLTWIPLLLALFIWWIFSQSLVRDLPFAVVQQEDSHLSRLLTRELDATSTLAVNATYQDVEQAKKALRSNQIYGFVVIPDNLSKDIYLGRQPQVSVFYNSQYVLVGRLISASVSATLATYNVQVGVARNLSGGNGTIQGALARSVTIQNQITALFNRNTDYSQFLVSAIVPAIWQIMMVVTTVLLMSANHRTYGLQKLAGKTPLANICNISLFYLPFFLVQGAAFLIWFYQILQWPSQGDMLALLFAQLVTVAACMIMGTVFFFLTLDAARAMSFAGAFTAPSFAFMGVTFPVTDMGGAAQWWRSLLPVSHYIEAQIAQVSYGVTSWQTIQSLAPMALYLLPVLLVPRLARKHLNKGAK